jgi:hypothetical protein
MSIGRPRMKTKLALLLVSLTLILCGCNRPPAPVPLTAEQQHEEDLRDAEHIADAIAHAGRYQLGFSNGIPVRLDTITGRVVAYVGEFNTGRGAWVELAPRKVQTS